MKGKPKDALPFVFALTVALFLALGGGYLFNTLPVGNVWKAVGLGMMIVGFIILFVWRIARCFPHL